MSDNYYKRNKDGTKTGLGIVEAARKSTDKLSIQRTRFDICLCRHYIACTR